MLAMHSISLMLFLQKYCILYIIIVKYNINREYGVSPVMHRP